MNYPDKTTHLPPGASSERALLVIGSSIVPQADDLPRRLSPICQELGSGQLYLVRGDESDTSPRFVPLAAAEFEEWLAEGHACRLGEPIPFIAGHWLIQMSPDAEPEYLPANYVLVRYERAAREALVSAGRAWERGDVAAAERAVWYAHRASPEDPLPLLLLLGLLAKELPKEELAILRQDLNQHSRARIEAARRRCRQEVELMALAELLERPIEPPSYLAPQPNKPGFLRITQKHLARSSPRLAA